MRRRTLLSLGVAAIAALPTVVAWTQKTNTHTLPIRVAVGSRASFLFRHLPLNIAQQLGFFASEGVQVVLQHHASEAAALQAMGTGQADLCAVEFEQLLRAPGSIAAGARCFVLEGRAPQAALGMSLRQLPGARTLADLVPGALVGVCTLGSLSHTVAALALEQAGMAQGSVSFMAVGDGASAAAALRTGQVQALCHGDPLMAQLQQQDEVRIVTDTRSLAGTQALFGGPVPGGCVVAHAAMLSDHAPAVQAVTHGMVRAMKWLQTAAPADIVQVLPKTRPGMERSVMLAAFARVRETFSPDGSMPVNGPDTLLRALGLTQRASTAPPLQEPGLAVLHAFARKSKLKFSA